MSKCLVLIDEPLENDERVLTLIKGYEDRVVINCQSYNFTTSYNLNILEVYLIPFLSIFAVPFYWRKLYRTHKLLPKGIFDGLKKSIEVNVRSKMIAKDLVNRYNQNDITIIHANDLFCGLIGQILSNKLKIKLVYDAHEVEFHRNRKNSLFRVPFDIICEQQVINKATQVIVVNNPIKKLYMELYNIEESKITVVNNNHFQPHMKYAMNQFNSKVEEVAIVYVGGAINGRMLEKLAEDSIYSEVEVFGFFLGKVPTFASKYNWKLGLKKYLLELLELVKKKRLIMWCCTEDVCLSYRLSLPNKFFQAIAIGIPVIASKGTYLSEIVHDNKLGYIYDGNNLEDIVNSMKNTQRYYNLLQSVALFQKKLFIDRIEL